MDKYRIIELVMIAVLTIVTTAVVTKLTLNKGSLGVTHKLKARFTPKFRAYIKLIFSVLLFIGASLNLYLLTTHSSPPTRYDVLSIIIGYTGVLMWLFFTAHFSRALLTIRAQEKAQKEQELWKPLLDQLKDTTTSLRETVTLARGDAESPLDKLKGSIVDKPSDSKNPKE